MRLILVRHAEADHSALSSHGRNHAAVIAHEIAEAASRTFPVAAVYSDPATAAFETAQVITDALAIALPTPDGAFASLSTDAAAEGLEAHQGKVWAAVESLQELHSPDSTLVIVSHEMPVRLLVCQALSIPLNEMHRFRIDLASLTTLDFRLTPQRRTILAGLNETCHLGSNS